MTSRYFGQVFLECVSKLLNHQDLSRPIPRDLACLCLMILALVACGGTPGPSTKPTVPPPPLVVTVVVTATPAALDEPESQNKFHILQNPGPQSIAELVKEVTPWVVSVTTETEVQGFFTRFDEDGAGSGFIVRSNGYVATNWHVVEGARDIKVHLPGGKTYDAGVIGRDIVTDLAVLKIPAENLPSATIADATKIKVGDWVMTMGNALALKGGPTVTLGIVSGLGRSIQTARGQFYDLIQTDAAVNIGNSGGPMVNMMGEVVGVNQATLRQAEGISFAVNSAVAAPIIDSLITDGFVIRPKIGLLGRDMTPAFATRYSIGVTEGVIITNVPRNGPAFLGGIQVGDVITKIDSLPTPDLATFLSLLWSYKVGDEVIIEYVRGIEVRKTTVKLAERTS